MYRHTQMIVNLKFGHNQMIGLPISRSRHRFLSPKFLFLKEISGENLFLSVSKSFYLRNQSKTHVHAHVSRWKLIFLKALKHNQVSLHGFKSTLACSSLHSLSPCTVHHLMPIYLEFIPFFLCRAYSTTSFIRTFHILIGAIREKTTDSWSISRFKNDFFFKQNIFISHPKK